MHAVSLTALTPRLPLSVWTATGPDARSFLQGQLTQDTQRLEPPSLEQPTRHQLTGLCSPKGRLLASLQQWAVAEACLAQISPQSLTPALLKRLRMYLLRAKVQIEERDWVVHGVWLQAGPLPSATVLRLDDQLWLLSAGSSERGEWSRGLLVGEPAEAQRWVQSQPQPPQMRGESDWWQAEIRAGLPWVWPETQEAFVPQMINFDLLDGIGFKKGCYTGQEVVARSQYLGKLNRRMFLFELGGGMTGGAGHAPGADIWQTDQPAPVGQVVMEQDGMALASVGLEAVQALISGRSSLHLGRSEGPVLRLCPLPYEVPTEPQQVNRPRLG